MASTEKTAKGKQSDLETLFDAIGDDREALCAVLVAMDRMIKARFSRRTIKKDRQRH